MKKRCAVLLICIFMTGCAGSNDLHKALSKIPGGFSKVSISASVPLYGSTNLTAINGRMVDGAFLIEHLIFDINSAFFDAHYILEGFAPDYPVGRQLTNETVESIRR